MNDNLLARAIAKTREDGLGATIKSSAFVGYRALKDGVTSRHPVGTNVYERDWDALIILDACRVDALRQVAPEFEFIDSVDSIWSVGSSSPEWMTQTFTHEWRHEIRDTTYFTANSFAKRVFAEGEEPTLDIFPDGLTSYSTVDGDTFGHLDLGYTRHSHELGNVPPRQITDRAIELGRERQENQIIVHYNQPHAPYIARAIRNNTTPIEAESEPFDALKQGRVSKKWDWEAYLDTLRLVLAEVGLLLDNLDAERAVISADHGEAFGECGIYKHPIGCFHPVVKKVPWAAATGTDTKSHTPRDEAQDVDVAVEVEDQLADLGYLD